MARAKTVDIGLNRLSLDERRFLRLAEQKHSANEDWFEFESFAFGMDSPLFKRGRSHLDVLEDPLYQALREMWIDLGQKQGHILRSAEEATSHGARREAGRSGSAFDKRNVTKKRDLASAHSSSGKRLPKSRT